MRAGEQFDLFERPLPSIDRRLFERHERIDLGAWVDRHERDVIARDYAPGQTPPRARLTDFDSSHEAADLVEETGTVQAQQTRLLAAVKRRPGLPTRLLFEEADMDRVAAGRRATELAELGLIQRTYKKAKGEQIRLWPAGYEIPADAGERIVEALRTRKRSRKRETAA